MAAKRSRATGAVTNAKSLIFDPLHYLALLERKTNALDQAAPLAGWELPEQFTCLRRLLEARLGKPGKREYVQVLRLLEDFRFEHVAAAVRQACELGAIWLGCSQALSAVAASSNGPPRLDLTKHPHLPAAQVEQTSAAGLFWHCWHKEGGNGEVENFCSKRI